MPNYQQYIGTRLTWDEAVSLFPDRWVVFRDYEEDHSSFRNGLLVDVVGDDEIIDYGNQHAHQGLYITRTTEGLSVGVL